MQFFLDTAHKELIKRWYDTGLVDGITTNPTHLSKEGGDPLTLVREICAMVPMLPVSIEITQAEPNQAYEQAKKIAKIANNVIVKIPCSVNYVPVIKRLVDEDIPVNVTLVFSVAQGLCMAKLGATYISPFVGRLDDIDENGMAVIEDLRVIFNEYGYESQILAASLRSVSHLHQAALAGADIATVPPAILEQALSHPLSDKGIATFLADWQKLGISEFP
jgi:transaldolase